MIRYFLINIFRLSLVFMISSNLVSCMVTHNTCQKFQLESTNVKSLQTNNQPTFRYEDSLVVIDYNFWASAGTCAFSIYNKADIPIYVNWQNSNFIYNGFNNVYWTDKIVTETNQFGYTSSNTSTNLRTTSNFYTPTGTIVTKGNYNSITYGSLVSNQVQVLTRDNPNIQIPPRSKTVTNKFSLNFPLIKFQEEEVFKSIEKSESPLNFRNYLAISTNKDFTNQTFIDNEFWISSVSSKLTTGNKSTCDQYLSYAPSNFYIVNQKMVADKSKNQALIMGCIVPLSFMLLILAVN